jgi:malonyl-CoA O-methyltransferase
MRLKKLLKPKLSAPVDVLTGYAHWAKNYPARAHNLLMELEEAAMLSLLPSDLSGKTCLDLACGSGRYLLLLQAKGAGQVLGSDYSAHMLAQAHATSEPSGLIRHPFKSLPFANEAFDLVICGLAVGHEKNLWQVLAEIGRVLRPGGYLLYSDFHPFGALRGWQRSFTAEDGATFHVEHYLHLYSHHQLACAQAGLQIEAVLEPKPGPSAPPEYRDFPVVLVIKAIKSFSSNSQTVVWELEERG